MPNGGTGENVVIFIVDMSSSVYVDNKKDILILNKGSTQGLYNTMLNTEAQYSINFTKQEKKLFKSTLQWKQQLLF